MVLREPLVPLWFGSLLVASAALIRRSAEGYPAFLRGKRLGMQILFDAGTLPLWEAYFSNQNPFIDKPELVERVGDAPNLPLLQVLLLFQQR